MIIPIKIIKPIVQFGMSKLTGVDVTAVKV